MKKHHALKYSSLSKLDFRELAYKYPNEASLKNNNPAGLTWNTRFAKTLDSKESEWCNHKLNAPLTNTIDGLISFICRKPNWRPKPQNKLKTIPIMAAIFCWLEQRR